MDLVLGRDAATIGWVNPNDSTGAVRMTLLEFDGALIRRVEASC